ncbi:MAG: hypothetical protein NTU47_11225 [Ignavibacteriales bacterium]|nr:hypothetical protein [Ignavibacteriales bacterium]
MQRILVGCFLMLVLLISGVRSGIAGSGHRVSAPEMVKAAFIRSASASGSDSLSQESYEGALKGMGFTYTVLDPGHFSKVDLEGTTLLVVSHASALAMTPVRMKAVINGVRRGMHLITDGPSPLLTALGIRLGPSQSVSAVVDRGLSGFPLHWPDNPSVHSIAGYPKKLSRVLYADSVSGRPLGVAIQLGRGRCIVLSPLFDELSGKGYSRFPTLPDAIVEELRCAPSFRRNALDVYFDAGYRFNVPIETLAAMWHEWGIRAVHAAAWYYHDTPSYDYKRLIDAAHKNGIVVYAWLEWPHVGPGFWKQHPEWRQKNALLQDAKLDFLHLMDLQNPDCLTTALRDLSSLLKEDWDGVDIAEFTITGAGGEALAGPTRPDYFVPFTPSAIAEYKVLAGYDPLELEDSTSLNFWKRNAASLDQFYRYRTAVNNRLLRQVIEFVSKLKSDGKRDWELIHTIVDNTLHPEFDHLLGFDQKSTLALLREYGVTLNVEDPYMEWTKSPERYAQLRKTLVALIPERPSMIDINVVPIHPLTQMTFATEQATGIELLQQLQRAGEQNGRVCVYCESSVFSHDWKHVPAAMAAGVSITRISSGWEINTPHTVTWKTSAQTMVWLDGSLWPCGDSDGVIIPPGTHTLTVKPGISPSRAAAFRLLFLSDELLGCEVSGEKMDLTYRALARCMLVFNKAPATIRLDGIPVKLPVLAGEKGYVVIAPSGEHRLSVSRK